MKATQLNWVKATLDDFFALPAVSARPAVDWHISIHEDHIQFRAGRHRLFVIVAREDGSWWGQVGGRRLSLPTPAGLINAMLSERASQLGAVGL